MQHKLQIDWKALRTFASEQEHGKKRALGENLLGKRINGG